MSFAPALLAAQTAADAAAIKPAQAIADFIVGFDLKNAPLRGEAVAFELDPRLVRGLDYYTRTAFEFTHGALGAQNAILGGGRYDGLLSYLGAPRAVPVTSWKRSPATRVTARWSPR